MSGRLVQRLADRRFDRGEHVVTWDGRDVTGHDTPSGVYWIRLASQGEVTRTERVLRLR